MASFIELKLSKSGTTGFKGFLVQAFDTLTFTRIGTFDISSEMNTMKSMDCGYDKSTATHKGGDPKNEISLPWKAPEDAVGHEIEFRFSVVQDYSTYWTAKLGNHTVLVTEAETASTEVTPVSSVTTVASNTTTTLALDSNSTTVAIDSSTILASNSSDSASNSTTVTSNISTTTETSTIATNSGTASSTIATLTSQASVTSVVSEASSTMKTTKVITTTKPATMKTTTSNPITTTKGNN